MTDFENYLWYTYIVECADGTYYTGSAHDLNHRIAQHNNGNGARYTHQHGPVKLIYFEQHPDRSTAMKRELQIKKLNHWQKRKLAEGFLTGQSAGTSS